MAACQRYLCFDWRTFPTSSPRFSFGVLSVVRIARARAHPCLSCDVYRLVGDNHRRGRALTEPITSIEAATVRQIIGIYFLASSLSLPRISVSQIGGPRFRVYILFLLGVDTSCCLLCEREGIALKSLDSTQFRGVKLGSQSKRLVKFEILCNFAIKPRSD